MYEHAQLTQQRAPPHAQSSTSWQGSFAQARPTRHEYLEIQENSAMTHAARDLTLAVLYVCVLTGCSTTDNASEPNSMSGGVVAKGLLDPSGIAIASSGRVYVGDSERGEVLLREPSGEVRVFVSGLRSPLGIAVDTDGSVLVSDSMANRIYRFRPDGELISTFGATGAGDGEFSGAGPLAIGSEGTIRGRYRPQPRSGL